MGMSGLLAARTALTNSGILEVQARKAKEHHVSIGRCMCVGSLTGSTLLREREKTARTSCRFTSTMQRYTHWRGYSEFKAVKQ